MEDRGSMDIEAVISYRQFRSFKINGVALPPLPNSGFGHLLKMVCTWQRSTRDPCQMRSAQMGLRSYKGSIQGPYVVCQCVTFDAVIRL